MTEETHSSLGTIYEEMMPADAGQRLVEATRQPLAAGVTVDQVRNGMCFVAKAALAQMIAPLDKNDRRKLESARKSIEKYDLLMRDLRSRGILVPNLDDTWLEQAIWLINSLLESPDSERRADYVRRRLIPYFLALYELSFAKVPTAYYYAAEERDGPALAFVRQAAVELDRAHSKIFAEAIATSALLGDLNGGTLAASFPHGDSLRRAIEPYVVARKSITNWYTEDPDADYATGAYRYALNLLNHAVFQRA